MEPPTPEDLASTSMLQVSRPTSACSMHASGSSDPFLSTPAMPMTPTPASTRGKTPTSFLFSISPDDAPTPVEREAEYQNIFRRFIARLDELSEEAVTDPNKPHTGLESVDPTPELLQWAETTLASLEDIKRRREAHIQAMYDQLEALWRRLGVSDVDMDKFVESHRGSTEASVRAYEEELDRMLELKRERMSTFVENARQEITKLWDELMFGEEERADFASFADGTSRRQVYSFLLITRSCR
jgi:Ase1/PRC1/MAP65 family protein